ncbi:YdcH family protein [Microbulbifer sp. YPW1]|uniref:YdcH family protein n=1 Tax=Microbulbifer sp. YPW1 TaxID=2745199 RepID=UPI0015979E58|nr:YdcH family protein [Microbulbifer sp. YPW1]QKX17285.1 YdcH family protein [Microbulbifer sp. YPW1]
MAIPSHALEADFPKYAQTIRHLREDDLEFRSTSDSYHKLDKEIRGLEERGVATDDNHFNQLKIRRAHMKDRLYQQIVRENGSA